MIEDRALNILKNRAFVSVATADKSGNPNAAPKFLLKIDKRFVYLIDYTMGRTAENLKANPKASLSFMDIDNLVGYRIDGMVSLIDKGPEFKQISGQLRQRLIELSAGRIIEASRSGKKSTRYEIEIPEKFIAFKIKINHAVEI